MNILRQPKAINSFVSSTLVSVVGERQAKKICKAYLAVWTTLALFFVPFVLGSVLAMKIQAPAITAILVPPSQLSTVTVRRGSSDFVSAPIVMGRQVRAAKYKAFLIGPSGLVEHVFPEILIENPGLALGSRNLRYVIPSVNSGIYTLRLNIEYALNPLKNAELEIDLVRIEVLA